MGKILAIGGISKDMNSIKLILIEMFKIINERKPKVLYIPTANKDHEWYCGYIKNYFETNFVCKVDTLKLLSEDVETENIRNRIITSNIIFVEGGNTLFMLETWKKYKVDIFLREAYENNIILAGLSAGAICCFNEGHSDSMSFYSEKKWDYIFIKGLSLLEACACPHFDSEGRKESFIDMFNKSNNNIGIGIDNDCGLLVDDDSFKVISEKDDAKVTKLWKESEMFKSETFNKDDDYKCIDMLFKI